MRARRSVPTLLAAIAILSSCTPRITRPVVPATLTAESKTTVPEAPVAASFLYSDSPEVQEAVSLYVKTGKAPIIKGEGFVQYPFGENEPLVTCLPLRACDLELEPGEEILNVALGDSERWIAQPTESGGKGATTPHLVLKPTDFNLMSNAVIFTTRRTYHVALLSPPEGMTPAVYARRVRFYYPAELVQKTGRAVSEAAAKDTEVSKLPALSAASLSFDYAISGAKPPWRPVRVFDDGAHVYLQMPDAMRADEAPALFVSTADGDSLVNYRVKGRFYVVDKLFEEARLVVGTGWHQETVTVRYTGGRRS